ncbi:putative acetyltransferase [Pseudomonas sp. St290]|nr:putative acetyltransferase [Pseudomonas sp. St290]
MSESSITLERFTEAHIAGVTALYNDPAVTRQVLQMRLLGGHPGHGAAALRDWLLGQTGFCVRRPLEPVIIQLRSMP